MPRNLVLLLDGTSNEVKADLTNVLKLYRICDHSRKQRVFYHPGVGTISLVSDWSPIAQRTMSVFGLATGWGLDENILEAYQYLVNNYQEGDRIFLFGFSRGAYTARALAGLIHLIGLIEPDQANLTRYALKAYKRANYENELEIAWHFRRIIGGRRVPIHFLGVWDTVASVFTRSGAFRLPSLAYLPYTKKNPSVRVFRQAAAIDERRSMFRLYKWTDGQLFKPDPFQEGEDPQDQLTVWFAGDHSDVGGGYAEKESQLAKYPLIWMTREAEAHGLEVRQSVFAHLALGKPLAGSEHYYVEPNPTGPTHNSLTSFWWPFEIVPKRLKWRRFPAKSESAGLYLPLGERRKIEDGSSLHNSVVQRMAKGYAPVNLPEHYLIAGQIEEKTPSDGANT
ncbi:hypothetical protein CSC94_12565 [Zhengella mangrovi]|uniref:T6SS Phospholipase effector Tle1-like catalytic domain-containing protein n=1 Tax=Zhengella mangrovi TaxID=1982044 RepID=A0A2G1QM43_9HYPH|nr:DUF2235 domain-containing protein [Zhengella mangrovi]PHP66520.1 hypothetical protein CSC94_12565 [Zhengella mangrovi]